MNHVAVIFAKDGSLGFPGKNMLNVNGKPLIAYTLDEIIKANAFTQIYVSSNSEEILGFCQNYADIIPILRSEILAQNEKFVAAVNHAIQRISPPPDTITIPQVVQPIREEKIFSRILSNHQSKIDSVVTVRLLNSSLFWMYNLDHNHLLKKPDCITTRKDIIARENALVEIDNAIVSFTYASWKKQKSITPWPYLGNRIIGIIQNLPNHNMSVDIHIPEDGEWLEYVLEYKKWKQSKLLKDF